VSSTPTPAFFRARTGLVAVAVALLAAACDAPVGSPNVAAVVNGEDVPISAVERRFEAAQANPQLAQQLEADESGEFRAQVQAQILTGLIHSRVIEQGARELDIEVTEADVAATRDQIIEEVGGQDAFDQVIEDAGLSTEDVDEQLREITLREQVETELTAGLDVADEDVEAFYEQHRDERYDQVSARHILTETEAEADEAMARLEAGEDFGELAEELSIDPGSAEQGGSLGEFGRGQMVPEFEEAAFGADEGEVVGPVESQFGFHVIEVTSRVQLELADVEGEIREELRQTLDAEATQQWLQEQLEAAEVEVNPRFGSWDAELGEVVPTEALEQEPAPPAAQDVDMELEPEG
jgi:peptidyl-prolyl cis-trans isomerase C